MVRVECILCTGAAVEPVLNRCGHLFCGPCLRKQLRRRHRQEASKCAACGRRVSPSRLTPIYGQDSWSDPGDGATPLCGGDDGCPAVSTDEDMMDIDGEEAGCVPAAADVLMTDVEGGGVDPMDVDGGGEQAVPERKMGHLECHICLDDADAPVATPCGHVYCCACLFQWLDGCRRKCPMCKKPVSESSVTLILAATEGGAGEDRRSREVQI